MSAAAEERTGRSGSPDAARRRAVPKPVTSLAAGMPVREVWENEVGGRTFEVGRAADRYFIKWTPASSGIDLAREAARPAPLIAGDGRCSGHVDLGELGVADRWADLAVATWSTEWNYGPGWEHLLLSAYGVGPDPDQVLPPPLGPRAVTAPLAGWPGLVGSN